jgi:protease II
MTITKNRSPKLFILVGVAALAAASIAFQAGCARPEPASAGLQPPAAEIIPQNLTTHGHTRVDNYYWLNERDNPKVIEYLEAENEYTKAVMKPTEALQEKLYAEIVGRMKQTDQSVPFRSAGYYYYTRFEEGKDYPVYCRKKGGLEADEEVLLNVNEMAAGHDYYSVSGMNVSPDNRLLAFGVDTVSRRKYTLRFKDLVTGEILPDAIPVTAGSAAWAADNKTVFYTKIDDTTLRAHQIYRHVLGTAPASDPLVYEETDETFSAYAYASKSKKYIIIASGSTLSNEYRFLDAARPAGAFKVFQPRERGLEYGIDHFQDKFYVLTNLDARNFRLMTAALDRTAKENWVELIPHREDVLLEGFTLFQGALAVQERAKGLPRIRIMPWDGSGEHYLDFGEETYSARIAMNPEFDTEWLRYAYSSMTTPPSTYRLQHGDEGEEAPQAGGGPGRLRARRLPGRAPLRDGPRRGRGPHLARLPEGAGQERQEPAPPLRVRLLRGDHGRRLQLGPPEPPRPGLRLRHRPHPGRAGDGPLVVRGRQAPQEEEHLHRFHRLRGLSRRRQVHQSRAAVRQRRQRRRPAHGRGRQHEARPVQGRRRRRALRRRRDDHARPQHPADDQRVRRVGEPGRQGVLRLHALLFPLRQRRGQDVPGAVRDDGLHDSQVQYFEPAKWVAKLRAMKTGRNPLLLWTNMEAGHGGASGRFRRLRQTAMEYAFMLDLAGIKE